MRQYELTEASVKSIHYNASHMWITIGDSNRGDFIVNFYMGNSIDEIDEHDVNVEFSDELMDFVYKLSKRELLDMNKLYEIDPYDDVEISKGDLSQIIKVCNYILDTSLLQTYEEPDEGNQMLKNLVEIAHKAQSKGLGLISVGD